MPLPKSTILTRSRRWFPSVRLCSPCAKCNSRLTVFAGLFFFSFSLFYYLTCSFYSHPTIFRGFSLTLSNFPLIISLLFSPVSSRLPSFSFHPSPRFLSQEPRTMRPTRAPHTIKRSARARYTHGWPLLLGVCGPTSCRGPCHVAPRPQQHAARHGLCSLVSRAHDSSQRRTERPTADRTLSAKKRVCFLPSSFLRLFFSFFFLFTSFSLKLSPCVLLSLFSPPPSFIPPAVTTTVAC